MHDPTIGAYSGEEGGRKMETSSTTPDRARTSLLGYLYLDEEGEPYHFQKKTRYPHDSSWSWSKARSTPSGSGEQDIEQSVCSASRAVDLSDKYWGVTMGNLWRSCSTETQRKMLLDLLVSLDSGESGQDPSPTS